MGVFVCVGFSMFSRQNMPPFSRKDRHSNVMFRLLKNEFRVKLWNTLFPQILTVWVLASIFLSKKIFWNNLLKMSRLSPEHFFIWLYFFYFPSVVLSIIFNWCQPRTTSIPTCVLCLKLKLFRFFIVQFIMRFCCNMKGRMHTQRLRFQWIKCCRRYKI